MNLQFRLIGAAIMLAAGLTLAPFGTACAGLADEAAALPDRALGKADAPITMVEYASLTCHHCADFQKNVFGKLKLNYIDTGKVRYIFRDFPLDGTGLKVAAMARCMPEDSYHVLIDVLFQNQIKWLMSEDPVKAAIQYAKLGGLGEADAQACAASEKLMDAITAGRVKAADKYAVQSTPTFIINDGTEKIAGGLAYEKFTAKLDALLAKAKK